MKYEYKYDEDGSEILVVYDGDSSYPSYEEINVCGGYIYVSDEFYEDDPYDGNRVGLSVEDWEEIKSFIDNQIALKGGKNE